MRVVLGERSFHARGGIRKNSEDHGGVMQRWYWRNLVSVEDRSVLFRVFAPTGRDSIAQGAALGDGPTIIGKPQRGVTPH
jgi:hypothetical protein